MSFEAPLGHGEVLEGLWRAARDGRLAHALLFQGPAGIGKFHAARWLAQGLLCAEGPGEPCGTCGPCRRVQSENHPDLFVIDAPAAGEDRITVNFIAARNRPSSSGYSGPSVESFLTLRAHEGGWRIVLVREADRMNENAQNAFLKTLEEPSSETLVVLETAAPGRFLATILSRVVVVHLDPLELSDARRVLAREGVEEGEADRLARWSAGAPGRALQQRDMGVRELREILAGVLHGELDAGTAGARIWDAEGRFEAKTASAKARLRVRVVLDLGLEILSDLVRASAGVPPGKLAHGDLVRGSEQLSSALQRWRMEQWLEARQDVEANMGPEAILERALSALSAHAIEVTR